MSTRKLGCALFSTACMLALACHANAPAAPKLADPYASRCQRLDARWMEGGREIWPQGRMLWGIAVRDKNDEMSTVLAAVKTQGVRVSGGHLVPLSNAAGAVVRPSSLIGAVLHGTDSKGEPMEVAICTVEPSSDDPDMTWYRIQVWNDWMESWQNPCADTKEVPHPRALALRGTWDTTGTHHDSDDEITFACETGAIAKCAHWGYKPWAKLNGQSLATVHQACTRMARADYCGSGHSHTREGVEIDVYDPFKILVKTTEATPTWNPHLAAFEAEWASDGATCLAQTRLRQSLDEILNECPGRFQKVQDVELGDGDTCSLQRTTPSTEEKVRNRTYLPSAASSGPSNSSP